MRRPDIDDLQTALKYMNELMDTPYEKYVRSSVFQLLSLGAIEFKNSGGQNNKENNNENYNKNDDDKKMKKKKKKKDNNKLGNKLKLNINTFPNAILTQLGKDMSKFRRADPRMARMLIAAKEVEKNIISDVFMKYLL